MLQPLVTVMLLTTYPKRAAWMADALLAYQLQDYPARELVVVNDGDPLRAVHPRVRVINVPPGLSLGARENIAARAGHGRYVSIWDDDDFYLPERLSSQVKRALADDAVYVRTRVMWLTRNDLRVVALVRRFTGASALVRRDAFDRVGGFPDTSWVYDVELYARLRIRGLRCVATDDRYYVHRRHDANVSTAHGNNSVEHHLAGQLPADAGPVNARLAALLSAPRIAYVAPLR